MTPSLLPRLAITTFVLTGLWLVPQGCAPSSADPQSTAEGSEGAAALPADPFPEPTGPFPVGLREEHWTDENRKDPFTSDPDDLRRVPVRIWYPARPAPGAAPAPYVLDPNEFDGVEAIQRAADVHSHAFLDADVDLRAQGFPVLLYHHGGGWPRFIGTALAEELASQGYVVVAVGHDGFNQATRRPDGSSVVPDALPFPEETGDLESDALRSWDHLDEHYFPQWVADARFALDRLEQLSGDGSWALGAALDLARVGSYGWSFGGATAIETAAVDPRIRAAADLDGQLFGTASEVGSRSPILLLGAEHVGLPTSQDPEEQARIDRAGAELIALVETNEESLIRHTDAPWYRFDIAGTSHGSFSDFLHFAPLAPPGEGAIEPARGHEILSALLLAFFDRHVRHLRDGEGKLLDDPSGTYPEVALQPLR